MRDFRPITTPALFREDDFGDINRPAAVTIHQLKNNSLLIDLKDTDRASNRYMLSIAGGVTEFVPQFDSVFDHFDFRDDDNSLVYLAVYRKARARRAKQDWSFLSV